MDELLEIQYKLMKDCIELNHKGLEVLNKKFDHLHDNVSEMYSVIKTYSSDQHKKINNINSREKINIIINIAAIIMIICILIIK